MGFEPTRPCGQTVFKTASLWPLRYLSVHFCVASLSDASVILSELSQEINNCRGIEVVITRRSWKPFVREGTWVRIPPSALEKMVAHVIIFLFGEVPKRLKGLPWKGSRSLIAVRGFKSRLLRCIRKALPICGSAFCCLNSIFFSHFESPIFSADNGW